MTSSVIRAVLWGVWHVPLLIYSALDHPSLADFPYSGWIAQKGFLATAGAFILLILVPCTSYEDDSIRFRRGWNPLSRPVPTRDHPAHLRTVLASYLGASPAHLVCGIRSRLDTVALMW